MLNVLLGLGLFAFAGAPPTASMMCDGACAAAGVPERQCASECEGVRSTRSCTTRPVGATESVTMTIMGSTYEISLTGASRNTYVADYRITRVFQTRLGTETTLEKVADFSTWKDMPRSLTLRDRQTGPDVLELTGLAHAVAFASGDCTSISQTFIRDGSS